MLKMNPRDPETQRGEENKLAPALRHEMGGDLGPLRVAPLGTPQTSPSKTVRYKIKNV